jgi:flagellar hook assembly protein FlgD
MTISGRVVREIRSDEIGPLQIGRNQTDFWWDGTDEFGDRLANGIYLYTVQARLHGQSIDLSTTAASPFFKNGIGKMYLLR